MADHHLKTDRLRTAVPRRSRPESLWQVDRAIRAYEVAAGAVEGIAAIHSDDDEQQFARALLAVLAAHMPTRKPGGPAHGWLGGLQLPEHAVCHGLSEGDELHVGCWDGDDQPSPWPCPAVRPILDTWGITGE